MSAERSKEVMVSLGSSMFFRKGSYPWGGCGGVGFASTFRSSEQSSRSSDRDLGFRGRPEGRPSYRCLFRRWIGVGATGASNHLT